MGHGGGLRTTDAVNAQPQSQTIIDPKGFAGFGYLLGDPLPSQRCKWGDDFTAARGAMARLAQAMPGDAGWAATLKAGVAADDNPFIPAGYTYLLQFAAHDLVQSAMPFWAAADLGVDSANCRSRGLMLDALYGGGPIACPAAFEPPPGGSANEDEDRTFLRLGRVAPIPGGAGACPVRDLARVNVEKPFVGTSRPPGATIVGDSDSVNFPSAHTIELADERNDDSVILSQLTVLFSLAHNIIAAKVQPVRAEARFAYARAAMLSIYHSIIRYDLLQRLLHPAIWQALNARNPDSEHWLWRQPGLPLEFSHGAFRVGHAMVRSSYLLNDMLDLQDVTDVIGHNKNFAGGLRTPMEANWVVQWSRFFDLGGTPNYARRIGASRSSLDFRNLFPNANGASPDGITFRDLLSAAAARTWSVDAMITTIMQRSPGLIPPGWMFANAALRRSAINQWLSSKPTAGNLTAADIAMLSNDPPLPLFVLLEAGLDPNVQGQCMGVLGSIVVGDVMFRRLAMERPRVEMLRTAAQTALPDDLAKAVGGVDSMPKLVRFVAQFGDVAEAPFI
ncbi:MAG TPA: peroxidase family protein [Acetobacteraceae bacterium]|nr:peroxidase family protein [Acetobacteraceae bacterium]